METRKHTCKPDANDGGDSRVWCLACQDREAEQERIDYLMEGDPYGGIGMADEGFDSFDY